MLKNCLMGAFVMTAVALTGLEANGQQKFAAKKEKSNADLFGSNFFGKNKATNIFGKPKYGDKNPKKECASYAFLYNLFDHKKNSQRATSFEGNQKRKPNNNQPR